jgi:transposase-like protein
LSGFLVAEPVRDVNVRQARRIVSVPVLAALSVAENGQKCLLNLRVAASKAAATWGGVITSLQHKCVDAVHDRAMRGSQTVLLGNH